MKKTDSLISILIILAISCKQKEKVYIYQVDSMEKILKERTYFVDQPDTLRAARGETASLQLVLKGEAPLSNLKAHVESVSNGSYNIETAEAAWVGYVKLGRTYSSPSEDVLRSPSGYFPDPILPDSFFSTEAYEVQPLWVSIPIKKETPPGLYKGVVSISGKINGNNKTWKKDFHLRVYPVTLSQSPLWVTNWFYNGSLKQMNNGETVEKYSPLYWKLFEKIIEITSEHRQNVFKLNPIGLTKIIYEKGKYIFDFSNFDKAVEICGKYCPGFRIEGDHLAGRTSGYWDSPFGVDVPMPDSTKSEGLVTKRYLAQDPQTENYLSQFLPALRKHLIEKGWLNKYIQHIADEPSEKNAPSFHAICHLARKYFPDLQTIDAAGITKELIGAIDIWVPLLETYHKDYSFYEKLQQAGKEVWFYTCTGPRKNYANRFIELPLIQTRLLHWINFKYGAKGYLHWGLNYWSNNQLTGEASRTEGWPAGDYCIIYPGYNKLYTSIRFEAMRDGIDDYQLLKMIEVIDKEKAMEFSRSMIWALDSYDNSVTQLRHKRKEMLELLSSYQK